MKHIDKIDTTNVWSGVICQERAIQQLKDTITNPQSMTNSWLFYGSSQTASLALAYASALLSPRAEQGSADGDEKTHAMVLAGTHPDLKFLTTEAVIVPIQEVRELVMRSQRKPLVAGKIVFIIEDLTRIPRKSLNVLLKALEEPHAHVVWLVCAPSIRGVLPTIRSRLRAVYLQEPPVDDLAQHLVETRGVSRPLAREISRMALGDAGHAVNLLENESIRLLRKNALNLVFQNNNLGDVISSAQELMDLVAEHAKNSAEENEAQVQRDFLKNFALKHGEAVPRQLQQMHVKPDLKKQITRYTRDTLDEVFLSCLGVCRDALVAKMVAGGKQETKVPDKLSGAAPERILHWIRVLEDGRKMLKTNVTLLLLLESVLVQMLEV